MAQERKHKRLIRLCGYMFLQEVPASRYFVFNKSKKAVVTRLVVIGKRRSVVFVVLLTMYYYHLIHREVCVTVQIDNSVELHLSCYGYKLTSPVREFTRSLLSGLQVGGVGYGDYTPFGAVYENVVVYL